MNYLNNKRSKNITIYMIFSLFISGCINLTTLQTSLEVEKVNLIINQNKVKSNNQSSKVKIEIDNYGFIVKAYSDAVLPQTNINVKSFWVFLTSDYNNPFTVGANPLGDGNIVKINKQQVNSITFNNIPSGNTYWAVIAAFDSTIDDLLAVNITKPDPTLFSNDKRWSRSINSVTISGFTPNYSDSGNALKVKVFLQPGIAASIDTSIVVKKGSTVIPTTENIGN